MGPVRTRYHSHHFATVTQSRHFVYRAMWQAKMASNEVWISWHNADGPRWFLSKVEPSCSKSRSWCWCFRRDLSGWLDSLVVQAVLENACRQDSLSSWRSEYLGQSTRQCWVKRSFQCRLHEWSLWLSLEGSLLAEAHTDVLLTPKCGKAMPPGMHQRRLLLWACLQTLVWKKGWEEESVNIIRQQAKSEFKWLDRCTFTLLLLLQSRVTKYLLVWSPR